MGPRLTLLVGCLVSCVGFHVLYRAITSETPVSFSLLVFVAILAGNGCTWFDVSPMSTNVRNFPTERGWVIGIIKSSIGLSGGLYSIVFFQGLFHGDAAGFLRFLSWGPSLVVLLCTPFVNYVPYVQESERCDHMNTRRFQSAVGVIGALSLYVMGVSLVSGLMEVTPHMQGMFALGAVVFLLPLFGITFDSGGLFATERVGLGGDGVVDPEVDVEVEEALLAGGGEDPGARRGRVEGDDGILFDEDGRGAYGEGYEGEGDDMDDVETREQRRLLNVYPSHTLRQCLCSSVEFYLLGISTGIGIGSGLSFLNNSPQLVGSLGGSLEEQTVVVAFFSCSSCLGRLIFGAVSESVMQRLAISRVWFLIIAALGSTVVYSLLSVRRLASPLMLYPLSLMSGLVFGGHWAMLPSLASELHGLSSFASIYSVLQLFPGVIAYVLGSFVGARYDSIGRAHGDPVNDCIGSDCFSGSFRTIALLSACGLALSVGLWHRTKDRYQHLVGELLQLEAEAGLR